MIKKCLICQRIFDTVYSQKKYCSKKCARIAIKKHEQSEKVQKYRKAYEKTPHRKFLKLKYEKCEKRKQYRLRYNKTEQRKKYKREFMRNWIHTPIGKIIRDRAHRKRRAAKNNIIEQFTKKEFMLKAKACKGICPSCKEPFNKTIKSKWLTVDHVYPVSLANKDFKKTGIKRVYNIEDVQPLCLRCNSSKKDKVKENM